MRTPIHDARPGSHKTRPAALLLLLLGTAAGACGGTDPGSQPPLPVAFDAEALLREDKADRSSPWGTAVRGPLAIDAGVRGRTATTRPQWFDGYHIRLKSTSVVELRVNGSGWGFIALYGPRQANDNTWGEPLRSGLVERLDVERFGQRLAPQTIDLSGEYMVVVGSPWKPAYRYDVVLSCVSGRCERLRLVADPARHQTRVED